MNLMKLEQKEEEAYKRGREDGKKEIMDALWKKAEESPTKTFIFDSRVVNTYESLSEETKVME